MTRAFDVLVVGAGPGGYVAAIRAAQLGLKVGAIERERLGGVCLNWGCIPTEGLLRTAQLFQDFRRAAEFGLSAFDVSADIKAVVERSRAASLRLNRGAEGLLRKNKVEMFIDEVLDLLESALKNMNAFWPDFGLNVVSGKERRTWTLARMTRSARS